ncbi:LacI family DNA-binding transcriptional regulator [Microbacterium sp. lyk4-40-TSB-66]|uniref:LacI family DNA-binding transcriptional regulator n=1 Tax=Microbacterium sp. lyk4-40-TSB-66 TaxID=3040294 RepID=UPI00254E3278|nr:LacI family DNA-binding transcriptional regulator [Microbacterium sp. lyk4-40-TSB-66]
MVRLSDVAARAGVSVSAVSRVLRDAPHTRVSESTRVRIQEAAAELGYRPNFAARALKSARTNVVGLVVPDVTNAIFTDLLRGVEDEAYRQGYVVLLARADGLPDGVDVIGRLIGEGRVDGLLVQVGDTSDANDIDRLIASRLPVVFVNSIHPEGVGSVVLDDEEGTRIATAHLIGLGHRRIALINGVASSDTARRREAGFRRASADSGLSVDDDLITRRGYEPRQGAEALGALWERPERPTAVVVANINASYGVLAEARRLGVDVPADLSVVAIHDAWTADHAWPPLTTVRMPLRELGATALRAVVENISSGVTVDAVVRDPAPVLVERSSTAPPRKT